MRSNFYNNYFILFFCFIWLFGCREDIIVYPEEEYGNSLYISSEPSGAEVLLEGQSTRLITPTYIMNLKPGKHFISLVLQGYSDTTFSVTVTDSSKNYVKIYLTER